VQHEAAGDGDVEAPADADHWDLDAHAGLLDLFIAPALDVRSQGADEADGRLGSWAHVTA
jgi:hypothetical protein